MFNDTIAAVATPVSKGGIGIIRLSGENSKKIAESIFTGEIKESHTIRYGFLFNPEDGSKIDEVLVTYMKAPHTYTREDVIEINCHSGIAILNKIMEILLKNGARQAENGEFTKRAFLNGRIDLTRAEAVIDIINAKTGSSAQNAVNQLRGKLYERIKQLMDKLLLCLANIEASIDYPEHTEIAEQQQFLIQNIGNLIQSAEALYNTADKGRIIKEGINTAIIGKTNVGKSSLLNYFAGEERAIVTEIHGTTRDTLEESVNLNGVLLKLTDTAGIRETDDIVEKIGIDRAKKAAREADLVLAVFDGSRKLSEEELSFEKSGKALALINKTDLELKTDIDKINKSFGEENVISISIKNGAGLKELENKIKQMFFSGEIEESGEALITGMRQKDALLRSINAMKRALSSLENGFPEDIASVDLMEAYDNLGEITGDSIDENLVDKIFSEFCLGK